MESGLLIPRLRTNHLLCSFPPSVTDKRHLPPPSLKLQNQLPLMYSNFRVALSVRREAAVETNNWGSSTRVVEFADINWDNLGFGLVPTDYMYIMKCSQDGKFSQGELQCFGNIELSPSSGVLNYGQGLFEGLKAYRKEDGSILLFRPEENALRMRMGAERMCMPAPTVEQFVDAVKLTVLANKRWVPPTGKGSLYIRPLLMGSGARIFNTMTKQMEVFQPKIPGKVVKGKVVDGKVGMYVCGVTAYDFSHIGHARAYVAFDVLYRYLQHLGYEVNYVRNFTDVDDKIINRANELGEDPLSLSRRFSKEFLDDMDDLQCQRPTHEPRVSDHMNQIKDMIVQIIHNGCAYVIDGDVYFSVEKFSGYGRLSGRKLEDNQAGARVAIDPRKKHLADFALWKSAKLGEPSWDSPWGPGRPGWHIECSAMSSHYLGESFDIHGGGMDLIFPHHENEIAQSCAACSTSNVRYWMHNGFVTDKNGKMSKSLGNFLTIREVFRLYHPLALRFFLISTHYRSSVNYSIEQLEEASNNFFNIYQALHDCEMAASPFREKSFKDQITPNTQKCINQFRTDFENSMANDLNTHDVLKVLRKDVLKAINTDLNLLKKKSRQQPLLIQSLIAWEKEVKYVLNILGLISSSTYLEVLSQLKDMALKRAGLREDQLLQVIEERTLARRMKDYKVTDLVRDVLSIEGGIMLMDLPNGTTTWRPCVRADESVLTGVQLLELIEERIKAIKLNDYESSEQVGFTDSGGDSMENKEA